MNKKLKIALGLAFIAAGIGLYVWNKNKDKDDSTSKCGEGEVPCPSNPDICYNPNAKYKKGSHPCDVSKDVIETPAPTEQGEHLGR